MPRDGRFVAMKASVMTLLLTLTLANCLPPRVGETLLPLGFSPPHSGGGVNSLLPWLHFGNKPIIMGILHHFRMEDIQSQMPAALPPLPKLRPRPGHLVAVGHVMTNRPITETSVATIEETGSTVSKLLMKSEFSRFRQLQVRSPE